MSQAGTKQKILNAAEQLFARQGYHATSLRAITATAGVNLAAVNYHFGGKEGLLESVFLRRLEPLNAARLEQLETVLARAEEAGRPPDCREILRTFVAPTFRLRERDAEAENFVALVGRALAEPQGVPMSIFMRHMAPLMERLFHALALSLPALSRETLFWRLHFVLGSLSHIMRCNERCMMIPAGVAIDLEGEALIRQFLDFTTAGLEAES